MKKLLSSHNAVASVSIALFFSLIILIPIFIHESYVLHVTILCMLYASLVTTWNLISGYTGIFTFGFQALFGMGGYVSALVCMKLGVSPWLGIFIGATASMSIGAVVAVPSLKLRQMPYIAISTMCLGEVIRIVVSNLTDLTRGELGLWGIPPFPTVGSVIFSDGNRVSYYYLIMIIFAVILSVAIFIVKSPLGMSMNALKDSQDAAESLGINVPLTKIKVFMISSFFAGIVGAFYAHYMLILTPTAVLGPQFMTELVAMGLIGGLGTIVGPILGAFLLTIMMEFLRLLGNYRLIIYGLLIVVTVIFLRGGIWGTLRPHIIRRWDIKFKGASQILSNRPVNDNTAGQRQKEEEKLK